MARTFHLTIARVGENLFDGDAVSVSLPGEAGTFEILAHHEPLVSPLRAGTARVTVADGTSQSFELAAGGIVEVSNGQATVLL
jgi:F-type H+-transporting ATPase subunit epsilon